MKHVAEDTRAAIAWGVLLAGIACYVAAFDIWAKVKGRQTMSGQFWAWLADPVISPFVVGGFFGILGGVAWHLFVRTGR